MDVEASVNQGKPVALPGLAKIPSTVNISRISFPHGSHRFFFVFLCAYLLETCGKQFSSICEIFEKNFFFCLPAHIPRTPSIRRLVRRIAL